MKTYNFFRGKQAIRKDEFANYVTENWADEINEESEYEFNFGEFKAVLVSEECECEECDGTGMVDVFMGGSCSKPMSECCGGCYADRECGECNGSGITTIEY